MNEQTIVTTQTTQDVSPIKIDPEAFYRVSDAAALLGVTENKIMILNRAGKLPIKKDGKLRLIHGATITAWLLTYESGGVIRPRKYDKTGIYAGKTPEEKKKVDQMLNEQRRLAKESE